MYRVYDKGKKTVYYSIRFYLRLYLGLYRDLRHNATDLVRYG